MSLSTPLIPPLPASTDHRLQWGKLIGASGALAVSTFAAHAESPVLLITPDVHTANTWHESLRFFSDNQTTIIHFPDWETLPYDHFSPHQDIISERLLALYRLPRLERGIVICAVTTLMHRLCPIEYLENNTFVLSCGEKFLLHQNRERLIQAGYRHVNQVMEHGEFALRGSIIDIYPMGSRLPYRIELFDDEVSSIRSFDPDTQRSLEKLTSIQLLPAREYPLTEEAITHFRQSWREKFTGNPTEAPIYQQISSGESASGIEYYLPLFYTKVHSLFDYLPAKTTAFILENSESSASQFWQEIQDRYEQLRYDIHRPLYAPNELFFPPDQINGFLKEYTQIKIHSEPLPEKSGHANFNTQALPHLVTDHKNKKPLSHLEEFLHSFALKKGHVLFCAETPGRRETLLELLNEISVTPTHCLSWKEFLSQATSFGITLGGVDQGFLLNDPPVALITESELFGAPAQRRQARDEHRQDPSALVRNLSELRIGDPVVHLQHGVGRYLGLQTIKTGEYEGEYLTLQYADDDKIYVPVSSLHLINRYTGADSDRAPLQKLGSKQWEKIKSNAFKQVRDVAAELLEVYGRRQATTGFAFHKPEKEYQKFSSGFPFEETPDQRNAIGAVITDMTVPKSMDRLICGDVGFGKTEVAMRAAFIALQNNKQVAILVPTTLLAEQHLHNFQDRFAEWPVKIAALSRLRSAKQQKQIIAEITAGKIDIVIGTHKLLSDDIRFKNLGLLIVDEEHRFGVRQKERIKSLRTHVDILTLTATPIPRTLNMALSGIRDLSLIATPPARRLSIKTFVHEYNPVLIREAIVREAMRGGQIYFLHNDVSTIDATAEKLKKIVPEARIAVAHGQMRERELERIMLDFYHQKYNVLVCSTIIESGIDIPTANTIIINRADRFGLAQLHQLRGRVGRSHHQAYAYLFTPSWQALSSDAKKRLEVISQLDELGVGFNLATYDLEIRGAGEFLGMEQSGHIHSIGFSLYLELLEEAVSALKAGKEPELEKPLRAGTEIDLGISALLPENYVADVHARLTLYKRLANCTNKQEIQQLKEELIDRFGALPTETKHLLRYAALRQTANALGIVKITAGKQFGYVYFEPQPRVDVSKLISLIQNYPNRYQLTSERLRFTIAQPDPESRLTAVESLLHIL